MSASREKKQRQGSMAEKTFSANEQAAAAKRKTIQYTAIGVVVAVLVAALLFWDTGIIQRGSTAVTIGDTDYSAAVVNYYYNSIYQQTALYAQYGLSSYNTSLAPEDQTYSTDSETGEVTTYADYFKQYAVDQLTTITSLYDAAIAAGYTEADVTDVVEEEMEGLKESAANNGYSSEKQLLIAYYGKLITPSIYRDIVVRQAIASQYLTDYTDALEYSDEELTAYYQENADTLDTFHYTSLYFKADSVDTTDADGNALSEDEIAAAKEQALADAKAKADEAAQLLQNGTSADEVVASCEPTSSSVDAATLGSSLNTYISEWITDSTRQSGEVDVVSYSDYGYYTVVFYDRYLDETPSVNVRHILIGSEVDAETSKPTEEQMAQAKARAEDLLSSWQTGKATEETFAMMAEEHSSDSGSNTNGGLYEGVFPGDFVPNFDSWLFDEGEHQIGDVDIVENNGDSGYYGYHIVYFSGTNEGDFEWKSTVRSVLSDKDVDTWLTGLKDELTVTKQSGIKYLG